jgi:hypothetical protein
VPDYPVPRQQNPVVKVLLAATLLIRYGRTARLALRLLAVAATVALAIAGAGWQPASLAVITGALTWLCRTARTDLARDRRN